MSGKLAELHANLEELQRRQRDNRLAYYRGYEKQIEFHGLGATKRERLFLAGNQLGKTWAGGMEMAAHLTGRYPDWWQGRRFPGPVRAWAAGVTSEGTRDNPQRILLGVPGQFGTGAIPKAALGKLTMGRGIPDAVDTIFIRHKSGGLSQLAFKAYEKGREKWQGETLDLIWLDEEPPQDIYTEALARTVARSGMIYLTCTPLLGMSDVIRRFLQSESPDRATVRMEIEEALHIPEAERDSIIEGYPEHEREARARGVPLLGSGRVFPVTEESIREESFPVPRHWPRVAGLDFGWDHPTAAAWLAWDRDTDTIHVYDCYRQKTETPVVHAAAVRARGEWVPVAWPHDGLQHDKGSGESLAELYRRQGVNMLHSRATFPDGGSGVEAGVFEILDRMQTGRFKVAAHLGDWWEEFRTYHRKDGRIVKEGDDLMAATRYGVMMLRHARTETRNEKLPRYAVADYDLLTGIPPDDDDFDDYAE